MARILVRKRADGSYSYTAQVRIHANKSLVHQESKTFSRREAAKRWARSREVELEDPTALIRASIGADAGQVALKSLISWYIKTFRDVSKWERTKQAQLKYLEKHPIGDLNALSLSARTLIDHVRTRRLKGAAPSTAGNDLIWIGVVLRAAKSVKELPLRPEVVKEARTACRELRLIGKSRRRERRPTASELEKLDGYFLRRDRRSEIPMLDIWHFAIESAKRESEICRLEWADNDDENRTGLVRDAKHPREKEGNHRRFKYTPEAWEIVQRQARTSPYIFPYNPRSVGAAFTRACKVLGIVNLHFHDGRHEGTSQLFERGYQIHEVAQITLHESWNELKRYTNLRPENLRDLPPSQLRKAQNQKTRPSPVVTPLAAAGGRSGRPDRPH